MQHGRYFTKEIQYFKKQSFIFWGKFFWRYVLNIDICILKPYDSHKLLQTYIGQFHLWCTINIIFFPNDAVSGSGMVGMDINSTVWIKKYFQILG